MLIKEIFGSMKFSKLIAFLYNKFNSRYGKNDKYIDISNKMLVDHDTQDLIFTITDSRTTEMCLYNKLILK